MSSTEPNQKLLEFDIKLTSNYPAINERTEVSNDKIFETFDHAVDTDRIINDKI